MSEVEISQKQQIDSNDQKPDGNCVASRPSIEGDTNEDSKEVKTDTLTLQATPLANGYVKAKTGTNDDVYNKWYEKVYEPQSEASSVVTEEPDPQG